MNQKLTTFLGDKQYSWNVSNSLQLAFEGIPTQESESCEPHVSQKLSKVINVTIPSSKNYSISKIDPVPKFYELDSLHLNIVTYH